MIIKFADDAVDSMIGALNDLSGYALRAEFTNPGYPEECSIVRADDNDVLICEIGGGGTPILNSTWHVGYDEIISFTVL